MNQQDSISIFIALVIFGLSFYFLFSIITRGKREGMENASKNGVSGDAADYAIGLKQNVTKTQDTLLVKKYRKDYENVIMDMEDYVNNMMLKTVISVDYKNETSAIEKLRNLNVLQESKQSLNAVMKFVDSQ
jgi:preprotein translocase subunit YajC